MVASSPGSPVLSTHREGPGNEARTRLCLSVKPRDSLAMATVAACTVDSGYDSDYGFLLDEYNCVSRLFASCRTLSRKKKITYHLSLPLGMSVQLLLYYVITCRIFTSKVDALSPNTVSWWNGNCPLAPGKKNLAPRWRSLPEKWLSFQTNNLIGKLTTIYYGWRGARPTQTLFVSGDGWGKL